jgi:hypothetical protein
VTTCVATSGWSGDTQRYHTLTHGDSRRAASVPQARSPSARTIPPTEHHVLLQSSALDLCFNFERFMAIELQNLALAETRPEEYGGEDAGERQL